MNTVSKKIVLLGNEGVGKTSLVKRYVHSIFNDEYLSTIGIKISKKSVIIGDTEVNLMLWDIAGNMMSKTLYNNYLKGAHGIILVCDAMRKETFESIREEQANNLANAFKDTAQLVLVNKVDLIEGDLNSHLSDLKYDFLTSAKTGENVELVFKTLAKSILSQ